MGSCFRIVSVVNVLIAHMRPHHCTAVWSDHDISNRDSIIFYVQASILIILSIGLILFNYCLKKRVNRLVVLELVQRLEFALRRYRIVLMVFSLGTWLKIEKYAREGWEEEQDFILAEIPMGILLLILCPSIVRVNIAGFTIPITF